MKILLFALNASWGHTNLALRCLRPPLERAGFEVVLMERTLKDRRLHILEDLYRAQADVYGFSCYIWNLEETLSLAESLRQILPTCRIVLGGPEVSYGIHRFDGMDFVDVIVSGEGEEIFPSVCQRLQAGEQVERVVHGGVSAVMRDEGILYRPDEKTGEILYYESSRGCPYSCAYCLSSATKGVRMKSVEQTLADLASFEELDCKVIKLVDRTFNADPKRANAIWSALLEERFTKNYHFEICASLLNEESFSILARFPKGKIQLEIGLQSTNPETLAASARHIDPQSVIEATRRVHAIGNIHVHLDLIAGLPYETYERFARSFDEAYGMSDMLQLGFLKLLYGTDLRQRAEEYGYRCLPNPPYTVLQSKWMHYEDLQRLSHIAEVLERYEESGRFAHALWYVMPQVSSPFAFWEGLTDYLSTHDARPLQRLSQPDVFRYFADYVRSTVAGLDEQRFFELLGLDFSTHEHKNPPYFLRWKDQNITTGKERNIK